MSQRRIRRSTRAALAVAALSMAAGWAAATPAAAEDDEAKAAFKAMSDFLVSQKTFSASYDSTLEIVTVNLEKVSLASSGSLTVSRPDKAHMTRKGSIVNAELVYDGKVLSIYGKNIKSFAKIPVTGSLDEVINKLRDELGLELPAADLLSSDPYGTMMSNVTEAQALGEGVIHGQSCDHLAFRTADVDWQIWISQDSKPLPCRFTITSKMAALAPSYTIDFMDWKTGVEVTAADFELKPAADAKEVAVSEIEGLDELPGNKADGGAQ